MYSKLNVGKNIVMGITGDELMAMEIGKGKVEIIGILFMKIKENKRKGR